jgi:hypothetical protein
MFMPKTGDSFVVELKEAHLNWGTHRYTNSRDQIDGEGYIQIPANIAYSLGISNGSVYNCTSSDGQYNHPLRASGNQSDPRYAKQFQSDGNLKLLGGWLHQVCNAKVGDRVKVRWTSPNDIIITYIP